MYGLLEFLQRSLIRREHVAGSAVWGQQLVPALGIIVILSAAQARHRRRLDPNFTVNAWGGPSYAGAMACHYLDLFLLAAGAAWLVDCILPE